MSNTEVIKNDKEFQKFAETISEILQDTKGTKFDWKKRVETIHRLVKVHETNDLSSLKNFKQVWNRQLLIPLGDNCCDLRSALSKEAFQAIPSILRSTGPKFSELLIKFFDSREAFLIKQLASANRTIVEPADLCVAELLSISQNPKWLVGFLDGAASKNNQVRICSQKYFNQVLTQWTISDGKFISFIEEQEEKIVAFMKLGLNDATPDARNWAQSNFHCIQEFNPHLCKMVWNECSESVHKNLNKTHNSLDSHNGAFKKNEEEAMKYASGGSGSGSGKPKLKSLKSAVTNKKEDKIQEKEKEFEKPEIQEKPKEIKKEKTQSQGKVKSSTNKDHSNGNSMQENMQQLESNLKPSDANYNRSYSVNSAVGGYENNSLPNRKPMSEGPNINNQNSQLSQNINREKLPSEKSSVSSKEVLSLEGLVKKFNETRDVVTKLSTIDKIIKQTGSKDLKGILLDNLMKGIVSAIQGHKEDVALFEKIMKLLEKLITTKNDKVIVQLDMVIPALLEFVNHEEFLVQEVSQNVLNVIRQYQDADQMIDSFLIGCNSTVEDLRLNALEVLTVLIAQTEVWLQVQDNLFKLQDCLVNLAYDCRANSEFHEPLALAFKNMVKNNESLSRLIVNSQANPKKVQLIAIVKRIEPEVLAAILDEPDSRASQPKERPDQSASSHPGAQPNPSTKEPDASQSQSTDFVNIWEEKDFNVQSDSQKTKSLAYVLNSILNHDMKNISKLKEFLSQLRKFVMYSKGTGLLLLQPQLQKLMRIVFVSLEHKDLAIKEQALLLVKEMVVVLRQDLDAHTEELFARVLTLSASGEKLMVNMVENILEKVCTEINPAKCQHLLLNYVTNHDTPILEISLKVMICNVNRLGERLKSYDLTPLRNILVEKFTHVVTDVRRAVVLNLVEIYYILGEDDFEPWFEKLNISQKKLLNIQIERKQQNR